MADKDDGVAPTEASVSDADLQEKQGELLSPGEQVPSTHSAPDPDASAASTGSSSAAAQSVTRSGQLEAPSRDVGVSVETSVSGCANDCKEPSSQPSGSCLGTAGSSSSRGRQTGSHRFAFLHHSRSEVTNLKDFLHSLQLVLQFLLRKRKPKCLKDENSYSSGKAGQSPVPISVIFEHLTAFAGAFCAAMEQQDVLKACS